jgi:hypothetical protein
MKRMLAGAVIVFVTIADPLAAQTSEDEKGFEGIGARSCAQFVQDANADPKNLGHDYFVWSQGFMSGLNAAAFRDGLTYSDLGAKTHEEQMSFLSNYCAEHHNGDLSSFVDAVLSLYSAMRTDHHTTRIPR